MEIGIFYDGIGLDKAIQLADVVAVEVNRANRLKPWKYTPAKVKELLGRIVKAGKWPAMSWWPHKDKWQADIEKLKSINQEFNADIIVDAEDQIKGKHVFDLAHVVNCLRAAMPYVRVYITSYPYHRYAAEVAEETWAPFISQAYNFRKLIKKIVDGIEVKYPDPDYLWEGKYGPRKMQSLARKLAPKSVHVDLALAAYAQTYDGKSHQDVIDALFPLQGGKIDYTKSVIKEEETVWFWSAKHAKAGFLEKVITYLRENK